MLIFFYFLPCCGHGCDPSSGIKLAFLTEELIYEERGNHNKNA